MRSKAQARDQGRIYQAETITIHNSPEGHPWRERVPRMIPSLDRMVERPDLGDQLLEALTALEAGEVGLVTGLQGVGGFGKTTMAAWACQHAEVQRRYPAGILWTTLGQDAHGAVLADRINDLVFVLSGYRPAISDPDTAGSELGRLLDGLEPVLLVVDDVWDRTQLRPFRHGGRECTRLVTSRIIDVLPAGTRRIHVPPMTDEQARSMITANVTGLPDRVTDRLARSAGHWPVLLNLVNGALERRVSRGQPPEVAADEVATQLAVDGPAAFDPRRVADRSHAVTATVEASLALLEDDDRERYLDLAIFPEDIEIPLAVLRLLWRQSRVDALCEELVRLGLVADYRLDAPGPRLILHDVIRAHLHKLCSPGDLIARHDLLIAAARELLPDDAPSPWWRLPAEHHYLVRFLPYHLLQAGRTTELDTLLADLRWTEAKTRILASAVPVQADLQLVESAAASHLRRALGRSAIVLGPIDPPEALGATLASRLRDVPGLESALDRYTSTLPRPRLEPARRLPDLPDPALRHSLIGHAGSVSGLAFSPDGVFLATAGYEARVRLWDLAAGAEVGALSCAGSVQGVAYSPDGRLLASGDLEGTVRLWDLPTRRELIALHGRTGAGQGVAFAPDGRLLAYGDSEGAVHLWEVPAGVERVVLRGHGDLVSAVAFAPSGQLLASAGYDGTIRLWDISTGAEQVVLTGHTGRVNGVAFAPDGRLLASAGYDGTIRLWTVRTGAEQAVLTGHTDRVGGVAFAPEGVLLASAGHDRTVRLWDVSRRSEVAVLTGHTDRVTGVAFASDGQSLASAGYDGTVRLWDVPTGAERAAPAGHTDRVNGVAFAPDGSSLASASYDGTVRLWDVPAGSEQAVLAGHGDRVSGVAFAPGGRLLASAGHDRTVRLWDLQAGSERAVLIGHTDWVNGVAFAPDGQLLASAGYDGTVRLWDTTDCVERAALRTSGEVWNVAFSPDGSLLASAHSDHTARLWNVSDGSLRAELVGHTNWVWNVGFSPDGQLLASAGYDGTVRLWNVSDGSLRAELAGHANWVRDVGFSPDGAVLASVGHDATVRLWDVATGRVRCALRVAAPLSAVVWHPDAEQLVVAGATGLYMFRHVL
ncbi:NB-ARC domain-containing protein [Nocardia sp. NBC_00508]|uniref:NB-ARC domain-containing protein n=1 Tax=Nocardia sp. NBC_00508 TaxID=2975992 RepID=UPI002E800100|nr:NB-ARC domain-containing protein [Nocardia sp. NBC_00508]WUD66158.1 NB-ARC domain-containing protein [Nocardia sp. NBC_00508]